ncbi:hypothetical protein [Actinokineospora sp.]|uniref:hypothetical protein n=1 Tax=Actinokineospora sp. TaxID=1872133 RepID=UPI003D6A65C7
MNLTPMHLRMLAAVRDHEITWRGNIGVSGGFATAGESRFQPGHELVALYELTRACLIEVDRPTGRVFLSASGIAALGGFTQRKVS